MIKIKNYSLAEILEHESFFSEFAGTFTDDMEVECKNLEFIFFHDTDSAKNISLLFDSYKESYYSAVNSLEINLGEYIQNFISLALSTETTKMTIVDFANWVVDNFVASSIKLVVSTKDKSFEGYVFNSTYVKRTMSSIPNYTSNKLEEIFAFEMDYSDEKMIDTSEDNSHSIGFLKEGVVNISSLESFLDEIVS